MTLAKNIGLTLFLMLGIAIFIFLVGGNKIPGAIYSPNGLNAAVVSDDKINGYGSKVDIHYARPFPSSDNICYTNLTTDQIILQWKNDSLLIISHPADIEFRKQKKESVYFHKTVSIEYLNY